MAGVAADDERRHRRGPQRLWAESWYFDFAARDASLGGLGGMGGLGGFVRLALYPNLGVAWYWAALVGQGRRLVLVRDHDLEAPAGRDLEVRGQGIWSAVNCETPLDHWSVGLEAFAVALDDPTEAWRGERGDLVGLGFDLEWEATAPAYGPVGPTGYAQACVVSGEILVGDERLEFDGTGHRGHRWGVQDWWSRPAAEASGVLADGASFAVTVWESPAAYLSPAPGLEAHPVVLDLATTMDPSGLAVSAGLTLNGLALAAAPLGHAALLLEAPDGRQARLARALLLYRSQDGRHGLGWASWLTKT